MATRPRFIGNEIFRHSRYGGKHPLAIPRVSLVMDLCRVLGWLPEGTYLEAPVASTAQLERFHDPDYVAAVRECEASQTASSEHKARFGLGANGNPVFGEIFRRPATACGATLLAAELLRDGGIVHSPAGGTHHGRRAQASGFCYFNDPVLGILAFLDQGLARIAYVDFDAHHGDGVEDALGDDPRVLIASIHEVGRWPRTGTASDPARRVHNFPVPADFNDSEFELLLEEAILPLVDAFAPEALILQCGADALAEDPMSRLGLSNLAYWRAVRRLRHRAPRLLVLGGGGYNPWAVARCWSGIWAVLNDWPVPESLPPAAEALLRQVAWSHSLGRNPPGHWFTRLADAPRPGPVREEVYVLTDRIRRAVA
ncbi:MAG: acetoin utilization protein AcuC [Rhodospirillaceae bacterium]|nr:acetoin utilization protein AcuC [Rhodospirillaceae bacterium]